MSLNSIRKDKGFWNGGGKTARESGGKTSGYPGVKSKTKDGFAVDLDEIPKRKKDDSEG